MNKFLTVFVHIVQSALMSKELQATQEHMKLNVWAKANAFEMQQLLIIAWSPVIME